MLFSSLRSKLTFATSLTAALILGVVITFSVITSRNKSVKAAKTEFHEKAKRLSLILKGAIDNSFSVLQTQNRIIKTLGNKGEISKREVLDLVESNLLGNKDYVGMCAIVEPNSLCRIDTTLSYLLDEDIFIPYLYYNSSGGIEINPLISYDVEGIGDYYLIPKQTNSPLLTEPYTYPINGKDVFMVTLSEPIIQNDVFWGITTIDYGIHFIQKFCQELAQEVNHGKANVAVISNKGTIVANSADSSLIGKSIDKIYTAEIDKQLAGIKAGEEEIHFQNEHLILDIPVLFSKTESPWRVHVAVPRTDIYSQARQLTITLLFIGAILILLVVSVINILTGRLTRPLYQLVENTKKIANGDLTVGIKTKQQDEVGELSESFNAMVIRLREMIDALHKSIDQVEKKNIELADKEEKFRKLFEEASDAIFLLHANGSIFDCNQSASEYFKLSKKELVGKSVFDLSAEYQPNKIESRVKGLEYVNKTLDNIPQQFEWEHINGNGEPFTTSNSLNKISLSGITYIQAIVRDITEKKEKDKELEMHRNHLEKLVHEKTYDLEVAYEELQTTNEEIYEKSEIINERNQELKSTLQHLKETQSKLLQSEKMASLGILTAGVAHEINNPLNYIMGAYVGLLHHLENKSFADHHEEVKILIDALKVGVDRSSEIVKGLNQFSRKSESLHEDCDIHSILNNSLTMMRSQKKYDIKIEKEYFHSDIVVKGNVGNLHQVFINILGNAFQSIEEAGNVLVKTMNEKSKVIIEINDTGKGISPENMKKITDPFFTTKDPGEGTGLGLSIAYNIIKEHKGELEFNSELGKGTSVRITLPKQELQ